MAGWIGVVTDVGKAAIENALSNAGTVNFNLVKTGTGIAPESNMRAQTALVNEVDTGTVYDKIYTDDGAKIRMVIGPDSDAYTLKEVGLYAAVTVGGTTSSVLIGYFENSDGIQIPDEDVFPDFALILNAIIDITDEDTTITINPSAFLAAYQGTENAGKYLIVDNNGFVVPTTVPLAEGEDF